MATNRGGGIKGAKCVRRSMKESMEFFDTLPKELRDLINYCPLRVIPSQKKVEELRRRKYSDFMLVEYFRKAMDDMVAKNRVEI